ncbi:MAG: hypothetical protein OEX81_02240 [Candidatus Pacebacteria bacterium]|nr:hypothetical protein [Candidatus Paceibacterota bacterium]
MEFNNHPKQGKSRLPEHQLDQSVESQENISQTSEKKKINLMNLGVTFFVLFVLLMIISTFLRLYSQKPVVDPNLDEGEEIVLDEINEIVPETYEVDISAEELFYEEPERIYHIEKRQQFCADDIKQARKLYTEYVGTKNQQVMEVKPATVREDQWIKDKKAQGAYRENLGERERNYYYEYPTTAGPYVDLMRIHKCEVFNPGGRIIPIISISEDGYIPEYELGYMVIEGLNEEEMVAYIQYMISLRHEDEKIQTVRKKSSGDYLTLTLDIDYDGATDWINLKKTEEVYEESLYKLNLKTGMLSYSAELVVRPITEESVTEN